MSVRPAEAAEQARTFSLRRVVPYVASDSGTALPFTPSSAINNQIKAQEQLLKTSSPSTMQASCTPFFNLTNRGTSAVPATVPLVTPQTPATASKLSFAISDASLTSKPAIARISPPKLHQPATPTFKIDFSTMKSVTAMTGARLAPDAQKEAMRLSALVDSLNLKISSQQGALECANTTTASLKKQLSSEKAIATKEIARVQTELSESKAVESDLRIKVGKAVNANETIRVKTVAPLQEQVHSLKVQMETLRTQLAEKPKMVEVDTNLERVANLENQLCVTTRHRDVLEEDIRTMRFERDAAMEQVMSMVANTGCGTYGTYGMVVEDINDEEDGEGDGEENGEEGGKKEQSNGSAKTGDAVENTNFTTAAYACHGACHDACQGASRREEFSGTLHAAHPLDAVIHMGTAAPGTLPRLRPAFFPSLSQVTASTGETVSTDDVQKQEHRAALIRAVMKDLYVAAKRNQTTRMQQSGESPESIEKYFASIDKARASTGAELLF